MYEARAGLVTGLFLKLDRSIMVRTSPHRYNEDLAQNRYQATHTDPSRANATANTDPLILRVGTSKTMSEAT